MSEPRAFQRHAPITLNGSATAYTSSDAPFSGDTTDTVIALKSYWDYAGIQCLTTSSLAWKVYVGVDNGSGTIVYEPAVSVDAAGTMTAANTAITPSQADFTYWNTLGASHVKISRTAGSGTIAFVAAGGALPVTAVVGLATGNTSLSSILTAVTGSAATHSNTSIADNNDTQILASNTSRKGLLIQNNSGATVSINLAGGAMTSTTPTDAAPSIVLAAGASFSASGANCPTGAIMAYQNSGAALETVSVVSW